LATAIYCGADAIVTFNESDFPSQAIEKFGIHTVHPDDFILDVDGVDEGTLVYSARRDLAHYQNPPLDVDQYVEGLRQCGVPRTAAYLEKTKVLLIE
jgi:hypothetical protein